MNIKSKERKLSTNKILRATDKNGDLMYYCPAYLRMKVKNIIDLNLTDLNAQINAALTLTIYYGQLDQEIISKIQHQTVLIFNLNDAIDLQHQKGKNYTHSNQNGAFIQYSRNVKKKLLNYSIRKSFLMSIFADIFWSPFEIIELVLTLKLKSIKYQRQTGQIVRIMYNLMDHHNNFDKISYTKDDSYASYNLAEAMLKVQYSNKSIRKQATIQKKQFQLAHRVSSALSDYKTQLNPNALSDGIQITKLLIPDQRPRNQTEEIKDFKQKYIQQYSYAHFTVPLYRLPNNTMYTIFLPIWVLAVINMGIFFQDSDLANRIASIAAIMISFVSFVPTIRSQIPSSPNIMAIEILVYVQVLTCILCLISSLKIRGSVNFRFVWYESWQFMLTLILSLADFLFVLVLFILHKYKWQPTYNRLEQLQKAEKFDRNNWSNKMCDKDFQQCNTLQFQVLGQ